MGRKGNRKLLQFVDALVATGVREIVKAYGADGAPADEEKAREVAMRIAQSICFQYARQIMYVPANLELKLSARDEEIWREYGQDGPDGARKYTPERLAQLAAKHELTMGHLYCIVRQMQRREIASRQGRLPGLEDDPEAS